MLSRRSEEAAKEFARVFEGDASWAELLRRMPETGTVPEELVTSVLRATGRS
jgi:hypothetical protein